MLKSGIKSVESFNPHPHAEGDFMGLFRYPIKTNVSIHTLTRRATDV